MAGPPPPPNPSGILSVVDSLVSVVSKRLYFWDVFVFVCMVNQRFCLGLTFFAAVFYRW